MVVIQERRERDGAGPGCVERPILWILLIEINWHILRYLRESACTD